MENNEMEGKFGVMWRDKMKGEPISHNLWEVVCGKGNLNGNKTAMQEMLGDKYESFELSVLRDLGCTVLPCVVEFVNAEAKTRKKRTTERRSDESRFKRNVADYNKRSDSSMRKHMASLQKMFRFNGVSSKHTGSKKDKKVKDLGMGPQVKKKVFDYSDWTRTLIFMDLNGTLLLLWREWIGHAKCYGECTIRPGCKEFFMVETKTVIGLHCFLIIISQSHQHTSTPAHTSTHTNCLTPTRSYTRTHVRTHTL